MKTTLYEATESIRLLNELGGRKFPGHGRLSLKIYDNAEAIQKKCDFLMQETQKIVESYGAGAADPEHDDNRMVVKGPDGEIDEIATKKFIDEIVELRKTEVEMDLALFTVEDVDVMDLSPAEIGQIRFMIEK